VVAPKVDGAKLKQALEEFGSLEKAVDSLKIQKKALEADVSALIGKRANRFSEIKRLENNINEYKQNLADLKEAFQKYKQGSDEYINTVKQFKLQYAMFAGFIAMLQTSPSEKSGIRELASYILMLGERTWDFYDPPDRLRYLFVTTVLGDYLKCYRCYKCGLKFIANKEPESYMRNFSCPNCGILGDLYADDSFLEAMLGSSSKPTDAGRTQDQGK
jgi:hypothetical protein